MVRTADLKRTFSKGDSTNWSYILHEITEIVNDTIPSYRIDNLPESFNEALLKTTKLKRRENEVVMKKLNITQTTSKLRCPSQLKLTKLFVETGA